MSKQKEYTAEFKAKVALEAIRGEHTIAELASRYALRPNLIGIWKKQAVDKLARVFDKASNGRDGGREADIAKLHAKIDQLAMAHAPCPEPPVGEPQAEKAHDRIGSPAALDRPQAVTARHCIVEVLPRPDWRERAEPRPYGPDQCPVPGDALVRLAADDPTLVPAGLVHRATAHAPARVQDEAGSDPSDAAHGRAAPRTVGGRLPAVRPRNRAAEPSIVRRRDLYPDAPRLSGSGLHHRPGEPAGADLAHIEQPGCRTPYRAGTILPSGDVRHGPGLAAHEAGLRGAEGECGTALGRRAGPVDGRRLYRVDLALAQIRPRLSAQLRDRERGPGRDRRLDRLAQWRATVLGSGHAHAEPAGSGAGEPRKIGGVIEIAIHLVPATKLPRFRPPLAVALVGVASLTILMIAIGFTKESTTTVPKQIRPRPEMSQNETDGIRSRPVQTLTVLGQPEERPSASDAQTSRGSPTSQSEPDRAKAGLAQRSQQLPVKLGDDQNSFVGPVSQTGSVRDEPAAMHPAAPPTSASAAGTEQRAAREGISAEPAQPAHGSPGATRGTEEHTSGPRVVIHWPKHDDASAELAKELAENFRQKGWAVAALRSVGRPVRHFEIRYPDRDARSSAVQVKSGLLRTLGRHGGSGSKLRLRRKKTANDAVEVWIPRSVR